MRKNQMMKFVISVLMLAFIIVGCGADSSVVGEFSGQDAGGILTISDDETWSYQQDDYWGSGDTDWSGTYSVGKNGKLVLECEDIILYVEKVSDDVLEVTSNSERWGAEDFRRIK